MKSRSLKPLFFILFLKIPFGCFLQNSTIIGESTKDEYSSSICTDNIGNIYLSSTIDNQSVIIKRDIEGNTLWNKKITFSSSYNSDISFLDIIGDTIYGCGWVKNGTQIIGGTYFKINANTGSEYWIKAEEASKTYFSCMRYSNGRYFLVGAQVNGTNGYNGKVLSIFSNSGVVDWQTSSFGLEFPTFNTDYVDDIMSASEMINGKMFLTGRSYVNGAAGGINMRTTLIGIDETGNIFLNKYLLFNTANAQINRFYGMGIKYDGLDSLVVTQFGDDNCSTCTDYYTGIIKLDLNGNVSWAKYYDIQGVTKELVRYINVTEDGYVLSGLGNFNLPNSKIFLLKTDKQGNFVGARLISQGTDNMTTISGPLNVGGASNYKNGKHYFAGSYYTTNVNNRDIVQIVVDQNLDDSLSCFTIVPTSATAFSFIPFSSNLVVTQSVDVVNWQSITAITDYLFINPCSLYQVDFQENSNCTSSTITATAIGLSNPIYSWSDGTSGPSVTSTSIDTFIVTITNSQNCCILYDTIVSSFQGISNLSVSLPNDTIICLESNNLLAINSIIQNQNGNVTYEWNTNETSDSIHINTSGTYWVDATDNCSTVRDSIIIQVNQFPSIIFDSVINVCSTDFPFLLNPTILNSNSIVWNDGLTTEDHDVTAIGNYTVYVTNLCGIDSLEILVNSISLPLVTLNSNLDTCVQNGEFVTLSPIYSSVDEIVWSNGSNSNQINVTQSGNYSVFISNQCGVDSALCFVTVNNFPELYLPSILDTCYEESVGFLYTAVGTDDTYQWLSGSTNATELISGEGSYTCILSNSCGTVIQSMIVNKKDGILVDIFSQNCMCGENNGSINIAPVGTDTFSYQWIPNITTSNMSQNLPFGNYTISISNGMCSLDTTISILPSSKPYMLNIINNSASCNMGNNVQFSSIQGGFSPYLFKLNNEDYTLISSFDDLEQGLYTLAIKDSLGCVFDTNFTVDSGNSYERLRIPNCFTPNNSDENNNKWYVTGNCIEEFTCIILNRWGNCMKTFTSIDENWDGTANDLESSEGVYFYKIEVKYYSGKSEKLTGPITLIR